MSPSYFSRGTGVAHILRGRQQYWCGLAPKRTDHTTLVKRVCKSCARAKEAADRNTILEELTMTIYQVSAPVYRRKHDRNLRTVTKISIQRGRVSVDALAISERYSFADENFYAFSDNAVRFAQSLRDRDLNRGTPAVVVDVFRTGTQRQGGTL